MKLKNQQSPGRNKNKTDRGILDLQSFLLAYPGMTINPSLGAEYIVQGSLSFSAKFKKNDRITDSYRLKIIIPPGYPKKLPVVREIGNRIPRERDHHVMDNGSLCLGSPLRLLQKITKNPSLCSVAENCIIPYLYANSHKQKFGNYPFSELEHGPPGEIKDYVDLFNLHTVEQVKYAIRLLGMKKRLANKKLCPCGCNIRTGRCKFNYVLRDFRSLAERSWFRSLISN